MYIVNLIPAAADYKVLSELKEHFYTHDFKYTSKGLPSPPHLTIGKLEVNNEWEVVKEKLQQLVQAQNVLTIPIHRVSDEIKKTQDYPEGEGWVALVFGAPELKELFYKVDALLTQHNVNRISNYVDAIRAIKGEHLSTFDCIANHINLCNHCKPEKVAEAKACIQNRVPEVITFDRLIVRDASSEVEKIVLEASLMQTQSS